MTFEATPSGQPHPNWLGGVPGDGISATPLAPLAGAAYAQRQDIEAIYGPTNTSSWADAENNGDEPYITNRIAWALRLATSKIDGRLLGGPYSLPFAQPYPAELVDATARLAGVLLYETRGITDQETDKDEPTHHLAPHRKMVVEWLRSVLGGKVRFPGLSRATDYPKAINDPISGRCTNGSSACDILSAAWIDAFFSCSPCQC
jgi:hypothetical protein